MYQDNYSSMHAARSPHRFMRVDAYIRYNPYIPAQQCTNIRFGAAIHKEHHDTIVQTMVAYHE